MELGIHTKRTLALDLDFPLESFPDDIAAPEALPTDHQALATLMIWAAKQNQGHVALCIKFMDQEMSKLRLQERRTREHQKDFWRRVVKLLDCLKIPRHMESPPNLFKRESAPKEVEEYHNLLRQMHREAYIHLVEINGHAYIEATPKLLILAKAVLDRRSRVSGQNQ